METEKILLAEIYKKDGYVIIEVPNEKDVNNFELYGFLKCYVKNLEIQLINDLDGE